MQHSSTCPSYCGCRQDWQRVQNPFSETTSGNEPTSNPEVNKAHRGAPGWSFHSNGWLWIVALLKALLVVSSANIRRRGRDLHTPAWGVFNPFFPPQDRLLTHSAGYAVCLDALAVQFSTWTPCVYNLYCFSCTCYQDETRRQKSRGEPIC